MATLSPDQIPVPTDEEVAAAKKDYKPGPWPSPMDVGRGLVEALSHIPNPYSPSGQWSPGPHIDEERTPETTRPPPDAVRDDEANGPARPVTPRVNKLLAGAKPPTVPSTTGEDISSPIDLNEKAPGALDATPAPPPQPTRDTELEKAVKEVNLRQKIGTVFQLMGIQPAGMDQPLRDLQERRQMQREHTQDLLEQEQHDPSSRPSRMLQALAVKRFGWSPKDAGGLVAADMQMVQAGFSAEQVRNARMDATKERRYQAELQHQDRQATIDERRWEAGERAKDRAAARAEPHISDRVTLQTQGTQEMMEAADDFDHLADSMGYSDAVFNAGESNRNYGLAVTKATQAEAKAVHGGPSESASREYGHYYLKALDPRATANQIRAQASELRRRAVLRGKAINQAFEGQGRTGPVPESYLSGPTPRVAGVKEPGSVVGYRYNKDRTKRIAVDSGGNQVGPEERYP